MLANVPVRKPSLKSVNCDLRVWVLQRHTALYSWPSATVKGKILPIASLASRLLKKLIGHGQRGGAGFAVLLALSGATDHANRFIFATSWCTLLITSQPTATIENLTCH